MRSAIVATTILAGISLTAARADIFTPSIEDQIKIGKEAMKEVDKEYKVLPVSDPRVKELRRIGAAIIAQIPEKERKKKPFEYTFNVIEDDTVNAFALPGGPVYFFTGLLDTMKTEDAVAGVLGHEITHIHKEHWARNYAAELRTKLGTTLLLGFLFGASSDVLNIADMIDDALVQSKYSRQAESESDKLGYRYMTEAGYNPQGMVDVFTFLDKSGGSDPPEMISSHPNPGNRVKVIQQWIKEDRRTFKPQIPRKNSVALSHQFLGNSLLKKGGESLPTSM